MSALAMTSASGNPTITISKNEREFPLSDFVSVAF